MQSSAEGLIQTISQHSNSTADLLILTQQFVHLIDENLTRHHSSLQIQNNDLQQYKGQMRKRLRDQDEIIERAFARIVTLEAKLDQTTKLATRALKRAKRSNSPPPQPILVQSPEPVASSSRLSRSPTPYPIVLTRSVESDFPIVVEEGEKSTPIVVE